MSVAIPTTSIRPPAGPPVIAGMTICRRVPRRAVFGLSLALAAAIHGAAPADTARVDTPRTDAAKTGRDADEILRKLLPPRSDMPADWHASAECLHAPGEPRALSPCVPPPPCDPSQPPHPFDLVGVPGRATCGPIYRGPCEPRSCRQHHGAFAWYHHWCDRMFDHFYRSK
jgi:hypothetical protein